MVILATYFIWFVVYSFSGWIFETVYCSIYDRKLASRGLLVGPYCPIYGTGALLMLLLLGHIGNLALVFLGGVIIACILEFVTSWALEKIFHVKLWDYSGRAFNFHGRIWLPYAVCFGLLSVLVILVQPIVADFTTRFDDESILVIAFTLFTIILIDVVYTVTRLSQFEKELRRLSQHMEEAMTVLSDLASFPPRRIIKAFPDLRARRYNEILDHIKQQTLKRKPKKHKKHKKHDKTQI